MSLNSLIFSGDEYDPADAARANPEYRWLHPSERKELYKQYADQLIASGNAYYAFDTPESLDTLRKEVESEGKTFIYNYDSHTSNVFNSFYGNINNCKVKSKPIIL